MKFVTLVSLIDLRYHSIVVRSLGFRTLFVLIEMPPGQGQMNSALITDLMFLSNMLIWKM